MKIKVIDIDYKGNGIARENGKVIFIPKTIPGDEVVVEISKEHKKYDEGRLVELVASSKDRNLLNC